LDRCRELSMMTDASVALVSELPRSHNVWTGQIDCLWTGDGELEGNGGWMGWVPHLDDGLLWCVCPECGSVGFEYQGRSAHVTHQPGCGLKAEGRDLGHAADHPRVIAAYETAACARFEHGERPAPW